MAHRVYYSSEIADITEQICGGLSALLKVAVETHSTTAWLVCDSPSMIDGLLGKGIAQWLTALNMVPAPIIAALKSKREVKVTLDLTLCFATKQNFSQSPGPLILTFRPSKELLDRLFGAPGDITLIVLPDRIENVAFWLKLWGATDVMDKEHLVHGSVGDSAVTTVLDSLWKAIGHSGPLHNTDKNLAIERFTELHNRGVAIARDDIRMWLMQQKAPAKYADEIADIAIAPKKFRAK
jgi:hypothetical protein